MMKKLAAMMMALAMMVTAGAAMAAVLQPEEPEVETLTGMTVNATVGAYNENTKTFRTYLYDCDRYDIEDIHKLQVGDILVADGRLFKIVEKSENPSGEILVRTDDGYEIYFTQVEEEEYQARLTDDDRMLMHVFAVLDLPLADGVVYEDNSNPDLDAEPVVYTGLDDILKAKKEKEETSIGFDFYGTRISLNNNLEIEKIHQDFDVAQ